MANEKLINDLVGYATIKGVGKEQIIKDSQVLTPSNFIAKYPDIFSKKVGGTELIRNFGGNTKRPTKTKALKSFKGSVRTLTNPKNYSKNVNYKNVQVSYRSTYMTKIIPKKPFAKKKTTTPRIKLGTREVKRLDIIKGYEKDFETGRFEKIIASRYYDAWNLKEFAITPKPKQCIVICCLVNVYKVSKDVWTLVQENVKISGTSKYSLQKILLLEYFEAYNDLYDFINSHDSVVFDIKRVHVKIFRVGYV